MTISRYDDLLSYIPRGGFYAASGSILPYTTCPYTLSVEANAPNTAFGVMLNGVLVGEVVSDTEDNVALIEVSLARGENTIELFNRNDGTSVKTYITTRDWATWLAAASDVLTDLDAAAEGVLANRDLATVSPADIDAIWGRRLNSTNSPGYSVDTYRDILRQLHQAYRRYGGKYAGIMKAVAAFTQVNPLVLPLSYGPQWRLGTDFIPYRNLNTYTMGMVYNNTVFGSAGVTLDTDRSIWYTGVAGVCRLSWSSSTRKLTWRDSVGNISISSYIPRSGSTVVQIDAKSPYITLSSNQSPYNTTIYNQIAVDIGGRGTVEVTLESNPALSATAVSQALAAAFAADGRYAGAQPDIEDYGVYFSITASDPITILTTSTKAGATNASHMVFGVPRSLGFTTQNTPIASPMTVALTSASRFRDPSRSPYSVSIPIHLTSGQYYQGIFDVTSVDVVNNTLTLTPPSGITGSIDMATPIWDTQQLPFSLYSHLTSSSIIVNINDCSAMPLVDRYMDVEVK